MFNDIHLGPFTLHMYGLMIAIGFLSALKLCLHRGKKLDLEESRIWGLFYCALIGGLLGAKILYILVSLPEILQSPAELFDFKNGLVVYGGIIGGILACWIYCHVKRIVFLDYFDLVMPAVSLAQGFGRIGCFCAGCCYGRETSLPIGIAFRSSQYAPNGVSLIPTQLISAFGDFAICFLLLWYAKKKKRSGSVGALWMVLYSIGRFSVEILRNDYRGSISFLSTSQLISLVIGAIGIILGAILRRSDLNSIGDGGK